MRNLRRAPNCVTEINWHGQTLCSQLYNYNSIACIDNQFQCSRKRTSKGETCDLGSKNEKETAKEGSVRVVEDLLQDDDIDGVGGTGVTGSHGSDEDVLLDGEGTRVKRETPAKEAVLAGGEDTGHEMAHGQGKKGDDRVTDRDLGLTKVEELVDKGDDAGPEETKEPHAEGIAGHLRIIGVCRRYVISIGV